MEKGLVDLASLRKLKNDADFRGKSAFCFVKGDKIIKVYASKSDKGYIPLDRNSICDFSKYESNTIVFPDEYIYENGRKAGEILRYIEKTSIYNSLADNLDIYKFMEHYDMAIGDIIIYSNILMYDLGRVNILYSPIDGFNIIDTTEWEINKSDNNRDNIGRFSSSIIKSLLDYLDLNAINYYNYPMIDQKIKEFISKFGDAGKEFYRVIFNCMQERFNFIRFINAYMNLYQKYYSTDLKTLSDMKELTKVIKKG